MEYECIGVCGADPLSGRCLGCGRPLMNEPDRIDDGALRPPAEESASCN